MMRSRDRRLTALLRPFIQKDASEEDVTKMAKEIEEYLAKKESAQRELGQILTRIINADRLKMYGTPAAQVHLKKWHKEYGAAPERR